MADLLKGKTELLKGVTVTSFAPGSEAFQQAFAKAAPGVEYDGNAAQVRTCKRLAPLRLVRGAHE